MILLPCPATSPCRLFSRRRATCNRGRNDPATAHDRRAGQEQCCCHTSALVLPTGGGGGGNVRPSVAEFSLKRRRPADELIALPSIITARMPDARRCNSRALNSTGCSLITRRDAQTSCFSFSDHFSPASRWRGLVSSRVYERLEHSSAIFFPPHWCSLSSVRPRSPSGPNSRRACEQVCGPGPACP